MSSFNSQYEEYYNSVKRGKGRFRNPKENTKKEKKHKKNFFVRRLTRDLIGVLILLLVVISCKLIVTPKTQIVYKYSRDVLNNSYNYSLVEKKVKAMSWSNLENSVMYWVNKLKSKLPNVDNYVKPLQGTITSSFGNRNDPFTGEKKFHSGIDIDVKENTEVMASFSGSIKFCGEDSEAGKYIIIDHGGGVETKYCHLNQISVKKGDAVKKGEVIAKSGNTGKSTAPHLHFELLYMGENINPEVIK